VAVQKVVAEAAAEGRLATQGRGVIGQGLQAIRLVVAVEMPLQRVNSQHGEGSMNLKSRVVLDDCRGALDDLFLSKKANTWRRRWIIALVLLRAVGHVLDKVDGNSCPRLGRIVKDEWLKLKGTKPEPKIFWGFIETRNLAIKEYEILAGINITITPTTAHLNTRTGQQTSSPPVPTQYDYVIHSGAYKGTQQAEVIREAIDWWDVYLTKIEMRYSKLDSIDSAGL